MAEGSVEVLYDIPGGEAGQLGPVAVGVVLTNVSEDTPGEGWWTGTTPEGVKGTFPGNYVKRLYTIKPFPVRALFDYDAQSETEISFKTHDAFTVIDKDEHGVWWKAKKGDVEGWFPGSSYVKKVDLGVGPPPPPPPRPGSESTPTPAPAQTSPTVPAATPPPVPSAAKPAHGASSYPSAVAATAWSTQNMKALKEQPATPGTSVRGHVMIQVLDAKNLLAADTNGFSDPYAVFWVKDYTEKLGEDSKKAGGTGFHVKTEMHKKTLNPTFNEQFKLAVTDPEAQELVIQLFDSDFVGKDDFLGQVVFSLRSVSRTIDDVTDKRFPLTGSNKKITGDLRLILQYQEKNAISKPKDFQHVAHLGLNAQGVFDFQNLPQEWLQLFKNAGIKKKELEDPNTAKLIIDVIQDFGGDKALSNDASAVAAAPPPPPPPVTGPPPPGAGAPPPPGGGAPAAPKAPTGGPPAPKPRDSGSTLLGQLQGGVTLRKASEIPKEEAGKETNATGLEKALANTIKLRREMMNEDEKEEEEESDDWT